MFDAPGRQRGLRAGRPDATIGGDWTSCDGYFQAVFYRGTEFLNAIRSSLGDDAFFAAIRDWVSRYRGGFVTG